MEQTFFEVLGARIVEARKAQGLRQRELADLANVSSRFLTSLENGKTTVELNKVLQVLNTLGLELQVVSRTSMGRN